MGHKIVDGILWLLKVTIVLTIVFALLAAAGPSAGTGGQFARDVLTAIGGTVVQLPDIIREARASLRGV